MRYVRSVLVTGALLIAATSCAASPPDGPDAIPTNDSTEVPGAADYSLWPAVAPFPEAPPVDRDGFTNGCLDLGQEIYCEMSLAHDPALVADLRESYLEAGFTEIVTTSTSWQYELDDVSVAITTPFVESAADDYIVITVLGSSA